MTTLFVILISLWLISGVFSFIYWYRKDYDVKTTEIPLIIMSSITGPLSFVFGYIIHGEGKTIFKKK